MNSFNRVQLAGMTGMAGAILWTISIVVQYSQGLHPPASGALFVFNQILAFVALAAMAVGYLGLSWGQAVTGRTGQVVVGLYVLGYGLIILGGIAALIMTGQDSPVFLLFPIGGLLTTVGVIGAGLTAAIQAQWSGWQRFMPLVNAAYVFFAIDLPFVLSNTPDGPGMVRELIWGVSIFLVALAVFTAQPGHRHVKTPVAP